MQNKRQINSKEGTKNLVHKFKGKFILEKIFIITFLLIYSSLLYPQEAGLSISGYFQSGGGILHIISNNAISNTSYAGKSTLRFNLVNNDIEFAKFEGSIDFNILYGMYASYYTTQSNGVKIGEEALLSMDLRKLYLVLKINLFDLYIGRQLIKFGEGFLFSPLDPFSSVDFTDVNFTRIGVDATRIKIPLSDMGYFEAIALPKSNFTNSDIATRLGFSFFEWDFSIAGYYCGKYEYTSAGFSFKGDVILGVYGEFAYHYKNETNSFWNAMLGWDYSIMENFIIRMECFYQSFDKEDFVIFEAVYPFTSKQYLMGQFVFTPTLIDSFSLSYVDNLEEDSGLFLFLYQRNLYQNVNLLFNLRYYLKDLTGVTVSNFDLFYYSLEFQVLY